MTALLAVLPAAVAVALAVPVPLALARASWTARAPRVALLLWQGVAWIGGLCTVAVPVLAGEALPGGGAVAGAIAASGIAAYLGVHVALAIGRREKRRRRHLLLLDLLAEPESTPGARVIEHDEPIAYCVPRPQGAIIVVSSGLVGSLTPAELAAVIAHERAHARQRHDVLLLAFAAWRSALPGLTAARVAAREVERLVELAADDRARRLVGSQELAGAILHAAPRPGEREHERVDRLLRTA